MIEVSIRSVSVVAPGLDGWSEAQAVLSGRQTYLRQARSRYVPSLLPPNERRRITPTIRIALQAAIQASEAAHCDPQTTSSVFVSTCGDLTIADRICRALLVPGRPVSPFDFHNSVHNAPAGYWAIGNHSRAPSVSLSAGPEGFAAGLLETAMQALSDPYPVLLVVYDLPPPAIMAWEDSPTVEFACGLVLDRRQDADCLGQLQIAFPVLESEDRMATSDLEHLRTENPAARCLPLLSLVAARTGGSVVLKHQHDGGLSVNYTPC